MKKFNFFTYMRDGLSYVRKAKTPPLSSTRLRTLPAQSVHDSTENGFRVCFFNVNFLRLRIQSIRLV